MDPRKDPKVKFFSRAIRKKMKIEKIILFGSRVTGENLKSSDYDFIVVSENFRNVFFTDRIAKMYDFWKFNVPIEVLCYTPEEFEKKRKEISIVREAVKTGLEIT